MSISVRCLLIVAMTVCGFFYGVIMPSRDMIVRDVTPPGSFGKVFGFVTTGFNIGGIVSPLIFGAIMDHGSPRLVFACGGGLQPDRYPDGRDAAPPPGGLSLAAAARPMRARLVKSAELPHVRGLRHTGGGQS